MNPPQLYHGDDRFAWHARPWTDFASGKLSRAIAILPVYGLTDWGLGRPLDAEEVLASAVLNGALQALETPAPLLVLPPLRHLPAQHPNMVSTVDIETAHRSLADLAKSVLAAGLHRLVLFNSNPFCEEWIDVAARDLRVDLGLQTFCLNLSGLGLDFHGGRSPERGGLQSLLTHLLQQEPDPEAIFALADPLAAILLPVETLPHADGDDAGALLRTVSLRLAGLLTAIAQHPSLPPPP